MAHPDICAAASFRILWFFTAEFLDRAARNYEYLDANTTGMFILVVWLV